MQNPKISIIVPCYNVEQYIHTTINSVIKQTYSNWELILVDDGSKDKTALICDEYAKCDSRIKVIHKLNGGLVSARNAGYEAMSGSWHMYLDGDDWININTCEELVKYIRINGAVDLIFWKYIQELDGKAIYGKAEWECKAKYRMYLDDECKGLALQTLSYKAGLSTACCKLINSEYAKVNKIYHNEILRQGAEGIEFSVRSFYYANSILFINEYFHHYRYNPNSISKKVDERNTKYIIDCFNPHCS